MAPGYYNIINVKNIPRKKGENKMAKNNNIPETEDYGNDIVTLVDENGKETEFEIVDSLVTENNEYFALIPTETSDNLSDDDGQLVILKVVEENGEVLGYAFCVITQHINNNILTDIKSLYIDDLCVDENARGKHIGTELYNYVLDYAKEIGCYNITLNVWSLNESAMKFYEKCGLNPQKTTLEKIL